MDLIEIGKELATAFGSFGLDALLEVPERFGVGDVVTDAQTEEVYKASAVKDLLLSGIVAEPVELLQHEDFEHSTGSRGGLPPLAQSRVA